jgi:hypothetical protein
LQDAFVQYAVVIPTPIKVDHIPQPELSSLPWLAVRHDAIEWFHQSFANSKPKFWKIIKNNPWASLLKNSKTDPLGKPIGHWPIDIAHSKESA